MFTHSLVFHLLLTFIVGTSWIYLSLFASHKAGSRTGGFVGGLPSTALVSVFFIAYTQSPETASAVTGIFPVSVAISGLFMLVFASLAHRGFMIALLSALLFWLLAALSAWRYRVDHFFINLGIYFLVIVPSIWIMEKKLNIRAMPAETKLFRPLSLLIRSVSGGFMIAVVVYAEKKSGPDLGGVLAAFPAMFISVLSIAYRERGPEFARAMTKPLMFTGVITVLVFAASARYFYLWTGLWEGTLLSVITSAMSAYLTFRYILKRIK